jgi:hypothetical protein
VMTAATHSGTLAPADTARGIANGMMSEADPQCSRNAPARQSATHHVLHIHSKVLRDGGQRPGDG